MAIDQSLLQDLVRNSPLSQDNPWKSQLNHLLELPNSLRDLPTEMEVWTETPRVESRFENNDGNRLDDDIVQVLFESLNVKHVVYHRVIYSSLFWIELSSALERSRFYTYQWTLNHGWWWSKKSKHVYTCWHTFRLVQTCLKELWKLKNQNGWCNNYPLLRHILKFVE